MASVIIVVIVVAATGGYYYYTLSQAPAPKQTVTVLLWGGDFATSFNDTVVKDFEAMYPNIQIVLEQGEASSDMFAKVQAMSSKPTIDMVMLSDPYASQAVRQGLCAPVDATKMPNLNNMYPNMILNNTGVGIGTYTTGLIYNNKFITTPVNSWWILWNDTYKGKIAVPDLSYGPEFLLTAAYLAGGSEYNIDPGFQLIKKMRSNVLMFFKSDTDKYSAFQREDVWIELGLMGDNMIIKNAGYPNVTWVAPKEGTVGFVDYSCIVKGGHEDLAMQLMNFYLQPKYAHEFGIPRGYAPSIKNVTLTPDEIAEGILTPEELSKVIVPNFAYVASQMDSWLERWNTEIIGA